MPNDPLTHASYRISGMDCSSCVKKIEDAARTVQGVHTVEASLATQMLRVTTSDLSNLSRVEAAVTSVGYKLTKLSPRGGGTHDDDQPADVEHGTFAYKRALWVVVGLNVGYGVVEMVGGFIARSQALKADALDFVGDGLISLLGLIAIGWPAVWRARSALLQGGFLAALGLAVLANTVYRVVVQEPPEAGLMGVMGLIALGINVTAAVVLLPHRRGDANMRAVWLFSRNDAIGNAATVVAALLVLWTGTPWPDLVVAVVVASLFLYSAVAIITDARKELVRAGS